MDQYDDYEVAVTGDREEIAAVVSGVTDGIRTGAILLDAGTDAVSVEIPDELSLEIELETADEEMSLELELEWPTSGDDAAVSPVAHSSETEDGGETIIRASDGLQSVARFEVYQARDAEWRWRLRHQNGNILATSSEGYTQKHNAMKGLRSVMKNSPDAAITGEFTE
jgi:amphi-Trp domain-containing protein